MTLRRCDSLPAKLREVPISNCEISQPLTNKISDSNTDPNFTDAVIRDEVIATWKSLYTDIKNIKNGFPTKNEPSNYGLDKRKSITHKFSPKFARNNRERQKKITYHNRHIAVGAQDADRSSSFPLDTGQRCSVDKKNNSARRKTLLERLLSWRTPECDCHIKYPNQFHPAPKTTTENVCTCGVLQTNKANIQSKYAERGRSKSVGYEAAREVTQFRRLVLCKRRLSLIALICDGCVYDKCILMYDIIGALAQAQRWVRRRQPHCEPAPLLL